MPKILIVDDDEIIARLASDILLDAGHACGWVPGGEQALDLLRWRRPDLLLLDQDMPGMTGSQVLRSLRSSADLYDLPVIMFTGISGKQDENAAYHNGAQAYLRKPFTAETLLREIDHLLLARAERPQHLTLMDHLEQATGRWRDAPRKRAIS